MDSMSQRGPAWLLRSTQQWLMSHVMCRIHSPGLLGPTSVKGPMGVREGRESSLFRQDSLILWKDQAGTVSRVGGLNMRLKKNQRGSFFLC